MRDTKESVVLGPTEIDLEGVEGDGTATLRSVIPFSVDWPKIGRVEICCATDGGGGKNRILPLCLWGLVEGELGHVRICARVRKLRWLTGGLVGVASVTPRLARNKTPFHRNGIVIAQPQEATGCNNKRFHSTAVLDPYGVLRVEVRHLVSL